MIHIGIDPALTHSAIALFDGEKFTTNYFQIIQNNKKPKKDYLTIYEKENNFVNVFRHYFKHETVHNMKVRQSLSLYMLSCNLQSIKKIENENFSLCIEDYATGAESNHIIQTAYYIETLKNYIFDVIDNNSNFGELMVCPILTWKSLVAKKCRGNRDDIYEFARKNMLVDERFKSYIEFVTDLRSKKYLNKDCYMDILASVVMIYIHLNYRDIIVNRFKEKPRHYSN